MKKNIDFKVVTVSKNTNSFGLSKMILMSQEGFTCSGLFNYLNVKKQGDIVQVECTVVGGVLMRVSLCGGEYSMVEENAPIEVIEEVWGKKNVKYNTDLIKTYSLDVSGSGTIQELLATLDTIKATIEKEDVGEMEDNVLFTKFFEE